MASCGERGLISYDEFLFLLAALSAPPRQFQLAFRMFDLDGNGVVDIEEFGRVQLAVQSQTAAGRRLHSMDSTHISSDLLARSQMLQRVRRGRMMERRKWPVLTRLNPPNASVHRPLL
jgi:hypothetical protein